VNKQTGFKPEPNFSEALL